MDFPSFPRGETFCKAAEWLFLLVGIVIPEILGPPFATFPSVLAEVVANLDANGHPGTLAERIHTGLYMRPPIIALFALAACASPPDPDEAEWQAYLKELDRLEEPANPGKTPNPSVGETTWFDFCVSAYDPWLATGLGHFPHRASWQAQRWLLKTVKQRFRLPRPFFDLDAKAPKVPPEVVEFLRQSLSHTDWTVRSLVAFVLGEAGTEAAAGEPELVARLRDGHLMVRASAARALARIGSNREEVPGLLQVALNDEEFVRLSAAVSIVELKGERGRTLPVLIDAMKSRNDLIRARATSCVSKIAPEALVAIPALVDCLGDSDHWVRGNAAYALGRMGPPAKSALAALERLAAADPSEDVRKNAAEAVKTIRDEK